MTHPRDLIRPVVYGIQRYSVEVPQGTEQAPSDTQTVTLLGDMGHDVSGAEWDDVNAAGDKRAVQQCEPGSAREPAAQEIVLVTQDRLGELLARPTIDDKRYAFAGDQPTLPCEAGLTSVIYDSTAFAREHMPQVDFRNREMPGQSPRAVINKQLSWVLQTHKWLLFDSGNSYHLYCPNTRLSVQEWLEWMGRLLLISQRLQRSAPDALRPDEGWIARSLVRGHSCLRWTGNHKPEPTLVPGPFNRLRDEYPDGPQSRIPY